jgi:hypothetical protein
LKGGGFTPEILRLFTSAFSSLMENCLSADLLRSLALFITYSLHKRKDPTGLQKKKSIRFSKDPAQRAGTPDMAGSMPTTAVAVEMLRMYCSLLCDTHDLALIKKFAKTVTNKVRLVCPLASSLLSNTIAVAPSFDERGRTGDCCPGS